MIGLFGNRFLVGQYFSVFVPALVWHRPSPNPVPGQEIQTGPEVHREEGLPGHDAGTP